LVVLLYLTLQIYTMKIHYLLLLLLSLNCFGQEIKQFKSGKVIYEVEIRPIVNVYEKYGPENDALDEGFKQQMLNVFAKNKAVLSTLVFTNEESFYKVNIERDPSEGMNFSHSKAGGNGFFYSHLTQGEQIHNMEDKMANEWLLISYPYPKWTITNETKEILGYTCYKAIEVKPAGKSDKYKPHTAWFTKEIPVSTGPKKFGGLPGLILEIDRGNLTFKAQKIQLDSELISISRPNAGTEITQEEFDLRYKDFFKKN